MNSPRQTAVDAQSNRVWKIVLSLLGRATRAVVSGQSIQLERANGTVVTTIDIERLEDVDVRRSVVRLGWTLTAIGPAGKHYSIHGLDRTSADRVCAEVLRLVVRDARELGAGLTDLERRLSPNSYMRYGESRELHKEIVRQVKAIGPLVERNLEPAPFRAFSRLYRLVPEDNFERARTEWNQRFVQGRVGQVRDSAHAYIHKTLTVEQCTAIATDEDATLVLAGAGAGKTSVIVGKAVDLIVNQGAMPREILVLAYNRKAVSEIRNRLPANLKEINVSTFHRFGMDIISDAGNARPTVSSLAEDDTKLHLQLQEFLREMVSESSGSKRLLDFLSYYSIPYRSPWDFKTNDEYDAHVSDVALRTLNGELVKSYEELLIANFSPEMVLSTNMRKATSTTQEQN